MKNFLTFSIYSIIVVAVCLTSKVALGTPFWGAVTFFEILYGAAALHTLLGKYGWMVSAVLCSLILFVGYQLAWDAFTQKFPFTAQMLPYGKLAADTKMAAIANPAGTKANQVLLDLQVGLEDEEAKTAALIFKCQGTKATADYVHLVKLQGEMAREEVLSSPKLTPKQKPTPALDTSTNATVPPSSAYDHFALTRKTSKMFEDLEDAVYTIPIDPHESTRWYTVAPHKKWEYHQITNVPFGIQPLNGETIWYDGIHDKCVRFTEETPTFRFIAIDQPVVMALTVEPRSQY